MTDAVTKPTLTTTRKAGERILYVIQIEGGLFFRALGHFGALRVTPQQHGLTSYWGAQSAVDRPLSSNELRAQFGNAISEALADMPTDTWPRAHNVLISPQTIMVTKTAYAERDSSFHTINWVNKLARRLAYGPFDGPDIDWLVDMREHMLSHENMDHLIEVQIPMYRADLDELDRQIRQHGGWTRISQVDDMYAESLPQLDGFVPAMLLRPGKVDKSFYSLRSTVHGVMLALRGTFGNGELSALQWLVSIPWEGSAFELEAPVIELLMRHVNDDDSTEHYKDLAEVLGWLSNSAAIMAM